MDDVLARIALIAAALVVAGLVTVVIRARSRPRPRTVEDPGLPAGVYLFTSAACSQCEPVRRALAEALGEDGFKELPWEDEPEVFTRLEVNAVPATLIVPAAGSATLWPGNPERALASLGP